MQHVLGTYGSLAAAEMAVRGLESEGFSIQNLVIADHEHRVWRKLHDHSDTPRSGTGFVVYTTDDKWMSEWARALLEVQSKSVPSS